MKIKRDVPFVFDTLSSNVNIKSQLPFLIPLLSKYEITKVKSSFYFSRSDALKRTFRIHFKKSQFVDLLIAEMKKLDQIEYVEKVPVMHVFYTPNDLGSNDYYGQYALYNIHAQEAWDFLRGDFYTPVAIVDNAIDINHEEFLHKVVTSVDISDDDRDPTPPILDSTSPWIHGTHCAGIACANTDNGIGIASIGFYTSLIAIKATPNSGDPNYTYDGYEGISWAIAAGAKVISCSWGTTEFSLTGLQTVELAAANDVTIVAAAGNDSSTNLRYPAGYGAFYPYTVVVVASVDIADKKASSSNYGSGITVTAPGVYIRSTLPGNRYGPNSGTSMATPLVTGLCALLRSIGLSSSNAIDCLTTTADNIDAQNPSYLGQLGAGRINAGRAVRCAIPCYPSIDLGSGIFMRYKTESSGTITSENTIPSIAQVTFDAAVEVDLKPGFTANAGALFHAYIDGCGGDKFSSAATDNKFQSSKNFNSSGNDLIKTVYNGNLQVYPNPTSSNVHLVFNLKGSERNAAIEVYDMTGRKVKQIIPGYLIAGKQNIAISLANLSSGMYNISLQLSSGQRLFTKVALVK